MYKNLTWFMASDSSEACRSLARVIAMAGSMLEVDFQMGSNFLRLKSNF